GLERVDVLARLDGHDDFFEGGVAGAFADAVDGAFDLPGAAARGGQGVRHGQAEVVVVVAREYDAVGTRGVGDDIAEHLLDFAGGGITDRIGEIDYGRACLNGHLGDRDQIVEVGAGGVLRGEFHPADETLRQT